MVLLFVLNVLSAQEPHIRSVEQDTSESTADEPDSLRMYRPPSPKKQKSYNIHMTEYMVKANLARLSKYAEGSYLNPMFTLDELFIQANDFPESVKNKMFGLALAGGAAREVFKHTRKELRRRKIGFIYPNLYGLNLTHSVRPLNARLHFRTSSLTDRYYLLLVDEGRAFLYYRETPIVSQRGFNYKFYKRWRLFFQRAQYEHSAYNGFGLSHSSKKTFFYLMYSQNLDYPEYSRALLYVNIMFDR